MNIITRTAAALVIGVAALSGVASLQTVVDVHAGSVQADSDLSCGKLLRNGFPGPLASGNDAVANDANPNHTFGGAVMLLAQNGGGAVLGGALRQASSEVSHQVADGSIDAGAASQACVASMARQLQTQPGDVGQAAHGAWAQARYRELTPGTDFSVTSSQQDKALATLQADPGYMPGAGLSKAGALAQWQAVTRFYEGGGNNAKAMAPFLRAMDGKAVAAAHGDKATASLNLAYFMSRPSVHDAVLAAHDPAGAEIYLAAQRVMVSGQE